ncbi:MAG: methyltransferase [Candidatus Cloacimonetes bacterium]|nr:methyltransferase [Candidatus Cloacimonadota bacterium]
MQMLDKFPESELLKVELPIDNKVIYQLKRGQSVCDDTARLVETVLDNHENTEKNVIDLGSGNGIIAIMLSLYRSNWRISGLEIQPELFHLSCMNRDLLKLDINFTEGDLKRSELFFTEKMFDLIVANPPYFSLKSGKASPYPEKALSRQEILCNMADLVKSVKYLMSDEGEAFFVYPEQRESELKSLIKKVDLKVADKIFINKNNLKKRMIIYRINYVKN